jgi:hypothetical protein
LLRVLEPTMVRRPETPLATLRNLQLLGCAELRP